MKGQNGNHGQLLVVNRTYERKKKLKVNPNSKRRAEGVEEEHGCPTCCSCELCMARVEDSLASLKRKEACSSDSRPGSEAAARPAGGLGHGGQLSAMLSNRPQLRPRRAVLRHRTPVFVARPAPSLVLIARWLGG